MTINDKDNVYVDSEDDNLYIHMSSYTHNYNLVCSECFNNKGSLSLSTEYTVSTRSNDIEKNDLSAIASEMYIRPFYGAITYCPVCGKETHHHAIDSGITPIVIKLNKLGLKTEFSCEGHVSKNSYAFEFPYIMLNSNCAKYFDMNNYLLKYAQVELLYDKFTIRLSRRAPIEYAYSDNFANDLCKYIDEFIEPMVMEEKNESSSDTK